MTWIPFYGNFYPGNQSKIVEVEYKNGLTAKDQARFIKWDRVAKIKQDEVR